MSPQPDGEPGPEGAALVVRLDRNWLSPAAAVTVVRSGAGRGFLSLPGPAPRWLERAWLAVLWHHRLAWHVPAGRVLKTRAGVLAFQGRTAGGARAWINVAGSALAVATLIALYLSAALAAGAVPLVVLPRLGVAEALRGGWPAYGQVVVAGASLVALFVMSRPRDPRFKRDASLTGLAGEDGWRVVVIGSRAAGRRDTERALLEALVSLAKARGIRRLVVDSTVLKDADALPGNLFVSHFFEGQEIYVADGLDGPPPAPPGEGRSTIAAGLLIALVPTALILGLFVTQFVLPAELRNAECAADAAGCMRNATDALYWALTTATTTGYGDLTPHSGTARLAAGALMVFGVTFWSALIGVLVTAMQQEAAQRDADARRLSDRVFGTGRNSLRDDLLDLRRRLDALLDKLPEEHSSPKPEKDPQSDAGE